MGVYLEVMCLMCGDVFTIGDDKIDRPECECPHCHTKMSKSQWRRAKVNFFVAEELLRQAAGALGDEELMVEARLFDYVCRGPNGLPVSFGVNLQVSASEELKTD